MTKLNAVSETRLYLARAERLMSEAEREQVVNVIAADPTAGIVIKDTGGLRKIRVPLEGRGKRGGARIIYWFHSKDYPIVLMLVFAKNEADFLSPDERKMLIRAAAGLIDDFGG